MVNKINLSIIICAHKEFDNLLRWESVIRNCSDDRINFIIKDSGLCEDTRGYFSDKNYKNLHFISGIDNGLYSALNEALYSASEYYLVAGADDDVCIRNVGFILDRISTSDQIILSFVKCDGRIIRCDDNRLKPYSLKNVVSSHSVGTILQTNLHERFGVYDETYNILADMKFLIPVLKDHSVSKKYYPVVTGHFSTTGVSSTLGFLRIREAYRACRDIGHFSHIQWIFMFLRLCALIVKKVLYK